MNHRFITSLQQLLEDPGFIQWARGEKPEDDVIWKQWADQNEERVKLLEKARELVSAVESENQGLTDEHIEHKISQALRIAKQKELHKKTQQISPIRPLFTSGWNVAASVLIVLGLGFALFRIYKNNRQKLEPPVAASQEKPETITEIVNNERALKYVQLPDGSSVVLHKNSSVKYPKEFAASKREVFLSGEAFFEVTKNPEQPFFVYANELVAKVHGTSFSVKARAEDEQVIVAVKTGKVSVFTKKDAKAKQYTEDKELAALVLTPNQQATFERSHDRLFRTILSTAILLNIPIENQAFTYSETPAEAVFTTLSKAYGVDIEFNREIMSQCSITATLGDEPLENKLKWICTILEAEYEITPEKITIKGNPCR
ncbi:FecR family protein [Dyadobacter pollutisoli]|jgi:ferric-dicitrate binding protein FerR (iron transport regulator)|uniref:FecR family protein n=1 Tax=Dyadobacter pollutisoli TaxID=2910158 RepID=A0A9E8N4D9_9BACT|nr:FecR family protein [Dyadobacter pollutisoli]WAC09500.1 FecR family protein [Dyadobacter pollutisoli]